MANENSAPIIVVKKKGGGHGHHGGAWKVAYADFVTAMMALFIVLWLLSSSEKVKKAVGGYFQDPSGNGNLAGSNMAGVGESLNLSKDDMSKLKEKIEDAMKQLPKFEQLQKNIQITVTGEGLRIELLENEKGLFFNSGSANISPEGKEIVEMLGSQLGALPNSLLIEGHTDAKPYSTEQGYSNWELSGDRANTARRILEQTGVKPEKIEQIRGFAAQHLRNQEDPFDARNRRVSVLVKYLSPPPGAAPAEGAEGAEGKGAGEGHGGGEHGGAAEKKESKPAESHGGEAKGKPAEGHGPPAPAAGPAKAEPAKHGEAPKH